MSIFSLNEDELISLNKKGFLPGPAESEQDFLNRVSKLTQHFKGESLQSSSLKECFDVDPSWITFEYSNKRLRFWEAGCVNIEANCFRMQLRKQFEKNGKYLGYHQEEVITHEYSHVARMAYHESKFEEIFAYFLSKGIRKWLGPLFQTPKESIILTILILISLLPELFFIEGLLWVLFKTTSFAYLSFLMARLALRQWQFYKALRKIRSLLIAPDKALAFLYRLTDAEIIYFSKISREKIRHYTRKQQSLRWLVITGAYPLAEDI